ncbi:MAG: oligonucleotide/oligosaccharide-binding-fold domain-containing protein, partial [Gemmobacter sp.]
MEEAAAAIMALDALRGGAEAADAEERASIESCQGDDEAVRRCAVAGFFSNAARLRPDGRYQTVRDGRVVAVHPSSVVYRFGHVPEWVVFHDITLTTEEFI